MCRAGGRRCKGSNASNRATQTARKQRSRANQALRQAKATGDPEAIAAAQQRLDQANANVQAAKENIVHHNDDSNAADHSGDVTTPKPEPAPITGELSSKPLLDNTWGGEQQRQQREEKRHGATFTVHNTNIAQPGAHVGSQQDINHEDVHFNVTRHRQAPEGDVTAKLQRAQERVARAQERTQRASGATTGSSPTVHTGPRDPETGARSVNVTGSDGNPSIQIGRHYGDVWINGKRVD